MAKDNEKVIGWYSVWRESVVLLRWLAAGDLHDDHGQNGLVGLRWFLWLVREDGQEVVTAMTTREVKALEKCKSYVYGDAAERGLLHGIGVWSPSAGAIRLTCYVPPGWPMVTDESGNEAVRKVWWTPDTDLSAVFLAQHRYRSRSSDGGGGGDAPTAA